MHQHVLFEDIDRRPVPRTRRTADGRERTPDGVRLFDLDGAVHHFNLAAARLLSIWDDAFADLPWAASPVVGMPEPAAGGDDAPNIGVPSKTDAPPAPHDASALGALRRIHCGHLTDDEFTLYLEECRRRGFDPFCRQLVPRVEEDWRDGKRRVGIITTIGAFTLRAQRTGEWEGLTPPQWAGPDGVFKEIWPDDVEPYAARQGVYRKGFREPVVATVFWKERAPYWPVPAADGSGPVTELDPFWKQQGRHQLAKCARAEAFREAFGEELGGVHTFDEMRRAEAEARQPRSPKPVRPSIEQVIKDQSAAAAGDDYAIPSGRRFEPVASRDAEDDTIPTTDEELAAAMKPMGFDDPDVRKKVIGYFHGQLSALFNVNPVAAYAKALDAIRQNPEHYGARSRARRPVMA